MIFKNSEPIVRFVSTNTMLRSPINDEIFKGSKDNLRGKTADGTNFPVINPTGVNSCSMPFRIFKE